MSISIVSYNLNGIRSAINKGWIDWVRTHQFDIIGVQETKAQQDQVDVSELHAMGYRDFWFSAEKKGYSGVAIFSKQAPDRVEYGMNNPTYDAEGRVIRADFGDFTLLNCYFPSGTSGDERQDVKMKFLDAIYDFVMELKQTRPNILLQGDYNIAHHELDIHDPKGNKKSSGFLPDERAWLTKWFTQGRFVDSYRHQHPDYQKFSWWNVRSNARATNKGWRIDYQSVTEPLKDKILETELLNDAQHSDHCPCLIRLDLP